MHWKVRQCPEFLRCEDGYVLGVSFVCYLTIVIKIRHFHVRHFEQLIYGIYPQLFVFQWWVAESLKYVLPVGWLASDQLTETQQNRQCMEVIISKTFMWTVKASLCICEVKGSQSPEPRWVKIDLSGKNRQSKRIQFIEIWNWEKKACAALGSHGWVLFTWSRPTIPSNTQTCIKQTIICNPDLNKCYSLCH